MNVGGFSASSSFICPPTFSGNVLNVDFVLMGHVAKDGEDGEPRDEAGDTVDGAGEQGIPGGRRTVSSSRLALPNLLMDGCAVYEVSASMPSPIQFSCAMDPSTPPSPGKCLQVQEISNSF